MERIIRAIRRDEHFHCHKLERRGIYYHFRCNLISKNLLKVIQVFQLIIDKSFTFSTYYSLNTGQKSQKIDQSISKKQTKIRHIHIILINITIINEKKKRHNKGVENQSNQTKFGLIRQMYSTIPKNNHDKLNTIPYSIAYFNEAVWDYYDIESLRNKKVTHFIRSHRTTFLPPIATFQS